MIRLLAPSVVSDAVDLSPEGSLEYAFPVRLAQEVFDSLVSRGFIVLGGDLWKKESDGFSLCGENWFSESSSSAAAEGLWSRFVDIVPKGDEYYVTFVVE
ncbi:hypothetical protein NGM33_10965 [Nocardiopsis dassonvillei]|uniref:hypothetical protein n=1 Tax=Nocardiopsis dassonvillei TaxID=2014 RepID=UPI0020A49C36|nr:hypothetical protein [Nocardiopsis dassonvillei]MCP3013851.1 hypothetical protein [Nocardiopsis dassonvillei]